MATKEKPKTKPRVAPPPKAAPPPKPKVSNKPPETFETAEAVALTKQEKTELSRGKILEWFRQKRISKLKGLRQELLSQTTVEQTAMKKKIIKRSSAELEKLNKDIPKAQREKMAEKFINGFFDAVYEDNLEKGLKVLSTEAFEQRIFFTYLGMHGGMKAIKSLENFKKNKILQDLFKKDSRLEAKYDEMVETGDMEALSEFLVNAHPDFKKLGKDKIYFTLSMFGESQSPISGMAEQVPLIGDFLKRGIKWIGKAKELKNFPFYKKASSKLGIGMLNLMNLAGMTLGELRERDRIFSKKEHRQLIENMIDKTKSESKKRKLQRHLQYMDDTKKVLNAINNVKDNSRDAIEDSLRKHLDKQKKLKEEDKMKIIAGLDLDTLTVQAYLPIILYGPTGKQDNESMLYYFAQAFSRRKRLMRGMRFLSPSLAGKFSRQRALLSVMRRRWRDKATLAFKREIKMHKNMKGLDISIEKFQKDIDEFSAAHRDAKRYKDYARDMHRHDDILRKYYALNKKISDVMSKKANRVLAAGAEIEALQRKGVKTVHVSMLSNKTVRTLELHKEGLAIGITDLRKAYARELMDLELLKGSTQKRFAMLSSDISMKVVKRFDDRWVRKFGFEDAEKLMLRETADIKRWVKPTHRAWHTTKLLALPAIAVGVPIVDLARGKARWHDVKWDMYDIGIGFVPVLGTINDFKMWWNGETTSGRKLSTMEKWTSFAFGCLGAISDLAWAIGGVGGVMRAGIGGLKSARGIARVGKATRGIREIQRQAEAITLTQRAYRWAKLRGLRKTERAVAKAQKADVYEMLHLQETFRGKGILKKVDQIADAELDDLHLWKKSPMFSKIEKYVKLKKKYGGADYLTELRKSFGISEKPWFLNVKRWWSKEKLGTLHKHYTPAEMKRIEKAAGSGKHYDDLMRQRTKAVDIIEDAKLHPTDPVKKAAKKDAKKVIDDVDNQLKNPKFKEFLEIQNKVFEKAERLTRYSLGLRKVARFMQFGLVAGGAYMLMGLNPNAKKLRDTSIDVAKYGVGAGYKVVGKGAEWAANVYSPKAPIDEIVESYLKSRSDLTKFMAAYNELDKSNVPNKKEQIENLCAKYWHNGHVQRWVYKHPDKVKLSKVIDRVKAKVFEYRNKALKQFKQGAPANVELPFGEGRGVKSGESK